MKKLLRNISVILSKDEKRKLGYLTALNIFTGIADIFSIFFLFVVINFYSPQTTGVNILSSFFSHNKDHVLIPGILLLAVFLVKSILGYYVSKAHYRFINNVASGISEKNLLLYLEGEYSAYTMTDSAAYTRTICFQPVEFAHFVLSGVLQVITEASLVILTITALLIYDAKLLLIIAIVLLPAIGFLSYITKKRLSGIRKNISTANEQNIQFLHEALAGYVESNLYNKNLLLADRYNKTQSVVNNYVADLQITQAIPSRFFEVFAIFGLFVFILAGQYNDSGNALVFFTLGAYMAAAYKIIPGISRIINVSNTIKTYYYTVDELLKNNKPPQNNSKPRKEETIVSVTATDVCFSYDNKIIFDHFNCSFTVSSFTAVTGASGKGKTTLINLLLGFLQPVKGAIRVNGNPVNEANRKMYWQDISYAKQGAFLLHDTIRRNITLLEDKWDEPLLENAIKHSLLSDFVNSFPEGLDRMITENGRNISGGQRQRLAIARALYKNSNVIILDEPFNELDEAAELSIMKYFRQLADEGRIVILVTHNKANLHFCTNIISLDA
ncbi:ABC transporter ATP-binding protein [Panacibacter sp. DH6]|uniref:ABC transporter ATP-binding protein n=1 Tax=Panacibacter microcysteis TaxID=2793269 RepID=A0A931E4F9_9BACT|nr:ABC transporter ATP-binding protein [Panacibacter microcysteis]MBG9377475.1 ABC transporter ATP-binding protein [Panacibacter microcysteis]